MSFGYLLDEHVNPAYRQAIRRIQPEIEVWRIGEPGAPPRHALDPAILVWCEQNSCILITNNRASMPVHLADHLAEGGHVPGIFRVQPGPLDGSDGGRVSAHLERIQR